MSSLKQKTLSGLKWSAFERFGTQGISFIITIIIARILSPSDYGILGMIAIFLAISRVFIEAGFGTALIRKQDRTQTDFSTVYYYNIAVSLVFYILLFAFAPLIAGFYDMPILVPVTRVVGINIVIGAFGVIHRTKLSIGLNFKMLAKISIISIIATGAIGIVLAYAGYGVWALIVQHLASTILTTGLLLYHLPWKPSSTFSSNSFKELFSFGSKLLFAGLLDAIYTNIYQMVIGKKYNAADLGYYTRADGVAQLPSSNITGVIQRVTFPVLSEIQHDPISLSKNYRKLLKMAAFIIFPLMTLLAALSEPLVRILLTDKWLPSVHLLQILCIAYMFYPIHGINLNLLQVKGRSDLFLRLEVLKKIMITIVLFVSFSFGIITICLGIVFISVLFLVINTHYTGRLIKLGFWKQMKDITPVLIISILAGIIAFLPSVFIDNSFVQLLAGGMLGVIFFIGIGYILKWEEMKEVTALIVKRIKPSEKKD